MARKKTTKEETTTQKKVKTELREIPSVEYGDDSTSRLISVIGWIIIWLFALVAIASIEEIVTRASAFLRIFCIELFGFYLAKGRSLFEKIKAKRKPKMLDAGILFKWPLGITATHGYDEWARSMEKGHYRVGSRGFEVWLGLEKIIFFYNVGITKERKDSETRYEIFVDYVSRFNPELKEKMPKFTNANIDLLDKRCFYHRSRFQMLLWVMVSMVGFAMLGNMGGTLGVLLSSIVCGTFNGILLFITGKRAYHHYKNELEIRKALPDNTGLVRDRGLGAIRTYWGFIFTAVLLVVIVAAQSFLMKLLNA